MVLWEITLGTAYFLGLKRTYRIGLKLQRRLVKRPKIRAFLQRRTRAVFDVALSVHKKVQQRDLEVGKNLGNWILRCLDRMKPSAQIRASPLSLPAKNGNGMPKHTMSTGQPSGTQNHQSIKIKDKDSNRHLFASSWTIRPKTFPTIAMMMHPPNTAGITNQYRHISNYTTITREAMFRRTSQSVFRRDIEQWLRCN